MGSGKNLDMRAISMADGANMHIRSSMGADNQKVTLTPASDGYPRITPVHSGKAVISKHRDNLLKKTHICKE